MKTRSTMYVIGVAALAAIVGGLCLELWYRFDHFQRHAMVTQINRLGVVVRSYAIEHDLPPGTNLNQAIGQLRAFADSEGGTLGASIDWGMFAANRDPWGHPFVFRVYPDRVVLGSLGNNGQDDGGAGDDLYETVKLWKWPKATSSPGENETGT